MFNNRLLKDAVALRSIDSLNYFLFGHCSRQLANRRRLIGSAAEVGGAQFQGHRPPLSSPTPFTRLHFSYTVMS